MMKNTIPFEIHLTVDELTTDKLPDFEKLCQKMGGKAVLIELPVGAHTQQPMLSVIKSADRLDEILSYIDLLKDEFKNSGFKTIRHKIEIPASYHQIFKSQNPHHAYQGYFEWHGKVKFITFNNYYLQCLWGIAYLHHAHISKNALKGETSHRFITVRHQDYDTFCQTVQSIESSIYKHTGDEYDQINKKWIKTKVIHLEKSQAEYCVYDDKLSLDNAWSHYDLPKQSIISAYRAYYPKLNDFELLQMCGYESFIRRASMVGDKNFMLKGSYVTRQYFSDVKERIPADLDFVCLAKIDDKAQGEQILGDWVQKITKTYCDDGVYFVAFNENRFWRRIEYAMHDDFPTVMTDVVCYIDGKQVELFIEVSLNLDIYDSQMMNYKTVIDEFIYPACAPLPYQIAWKIHQCLVRPRVKDIADLTFLARMLYDHQSQNVLEILCQECQRDNIGVDKIIKFFEYQANDLFFGNDELKSPSLLQKMTTYFKQKDMPDQYQKEQLWWQTQRAKLLPSFPTLPESFEKFYQNFCHSMKNAGFDKQSVSEKIKQLMNDSE